MTDGPMLGDILAVFDAQYPPATAEPWDAVGLVCGDPTRTVRRVLFTVDPDPRVVAEALEWRADLVVAHHPLLLRPVHGVAADTAKGRVVTDLVEGRCALFTAHTNADAASGGVSDALADVLGVVDTQPLAAADDAQLAIVTFVPPAAAQRVVDAMADAGAGTIGDYTRCSWSVAGTGQFLPDAGAHPVIGTPGRLETTSEVRVEMVVPLDLRDQVVAALVDAHPYEEVTHFDTVLAPRPASIGLGRVGWLDEPIPLSAFAERVAEALPTTPAGVRVAGDPNRVVHRVAVCGGAGDSLLAVAAEQGADVFVTADLRHHPAAEHLGEGRPALVDAGHFASEWPWLPAAARRLADALAERGTTVETRVSTLVTDPWNSLVSAVPEEQP